MSSSSTQMAATTHDMVGKMHDMIVDIAELRDNIANFDDFFRPMRNYFYWEPHCFDIPVCWSIRSIFDTLDGIDTMTDDIQEPRCRTMDRLDALMPQMVALMPTDDRDHEDHEDHDADACIRRRRACRTRWRRCRTNSTAMGEAFDDVEERRLVLPAAGGLREPGLQARHEEFLSPDGHAVRFIISHEGDPMTPEGISHIDAIKQAAKEAIKGTPLEGSKIYLGGTAATFKDMQDGANYDLLIAGIAALGLIFIIMLIITRSRRRRGGDRRHRGAVAGCVVRSVGADLAAHPRHRAALDGAGDVGHHPAGGRARTTTCCWCRGSRRRSTPGLNTGIIRAMGGTGSVVTSAGLVFAFTMASMAVSELTVIAQVGTTIGLGLLFDTLVIRSFMTPSIAALLGRWFWWPQNVSDPSGP